MPKINHLKTAAANSESSNAAIVRLIWGAKAQQGINDDDLCAFLGGRSRTFLGLRKKNPDTFTIGDLRRLCRGLNITPDELRSAIDF